MTRQRRCGWLGLGAAVLAIVLIGATGQRLLAQSAPTGQVAVVTDPEGLNLRGGPGTTYPVLAVLPQGTQVPILGERVNTNWLPVSYQGQLGFVHSDFVQIRAAGATTPPGQSTSPGSGPSAPAPTPTPAPTPPPLPALTPGSGITKI
jgi:uncharacterized protein YraI